MTITDVLCVLKGDPSVSTMEHCGNLLEATSTYIQKLSEVRLSVRACIRAFICAFVICKSACFGGHNCIRPISKTVFSGLHPNDVGGDQGNKCTGAIGKRKI